MCLNAVDDTIARLSSRVADERKAKLKAWLDSDPMLRKEIIAGTPELRDLEKHVAKLERLAIGFRERV